MEFAESSNVSKLEGLKLDEEKMICHIMRSKNCSKLAKEYFIHGYFIGIVYGVCRIVKCF
jgi:hypothetical protein